VCHNKGKTVKMVATESISPPKPEAPLACLFENPNRLVSLWDMLRLKAHDFVGAFSTIAQSMASLRLGHKPSANDADSVGKNMNMLHGYCSELGLQLSAILIKRYRHID
jgi:hypothetical protein